MCNKLKALQILLESKADVNLPVSHFVKDNSSYEHMSPLYAAIRFCRDAKIIRCLMDHEADPNQATLVDKTWITPNSMSDTHLAACVKRIFHT